MRFACAIVVAGFGLRAATAGEFPYTAEVVHEAALVRCGPGETYYPTSRLMRGSQVEVYRHDAHGWCAIRPPEGEFSLVAAERLKLLPGDDLGEVVGQEAPVWVGSQIAKPAEHRWQLHLQPGERVVVLGVRAGDAQEPGASFWYKVAPPAGEFRWIHRDALGAPEETGPPASPNPESPAATQLLETLSPTEGLPPTADEAVSEGSLANRAGLAPEDPPAPAVLVIAEGEAAPLPKPSGDAVSADDQPLPGPADLASAVVKASANIPANEEPPAKAPTSETLSLPAFAETDRRIEPAPRAPTAETPQAAGGGAPSESASHDAFETELLAINLDLTWAVAKDLGEWRLGPLEERARRLQQLAATNEECERAAALLESILRFEQLYQRYRQLSTSAALP